MREETTLAAAMPIAASPVTPGVESEAPFACWSALDRSFRKHLCLHPQASPARRASAPLSAFASLRHYCNQGPRRGLGARRRFRVSAAATWSEDQRARS